MVSPILNAVSNGYGARVILKRIATMYPQHANKIMAAEAAGYASEKILKHLDNKKGSDDSDDYLTDHEKVQKRTAEQKKRAALQVMGVLGTAGAIGAGAYAYANRNNALRGEILPALPGNQKQLPGPQGQGRLPGPQEPRQPPPSPSQPSPPQMSPQQQQGAQPSQQQNQPEPYAERNIAQSVDLIDNLREQTRIENAINSGYDPITTSYMLRQVMPKNKIAIFDKAEGGLERVVSDYMNYMKNKPLEKEQDQPPQEIERRQQDLQERQQQANISEDNLPSQQPPQQAPEESIQRVQLQQPEAAKKQEIMTPDAMQAPEQKITPLQQTERNIASKIQQPETSGNLALLPKGQIGEIESIKNGVAKINVDGNIINKKLSEIEYEPQGVENAVRHVVNSIPEGMKSTALQSVVHVPIEGLNLMLAQFYDGKWAWYKDVPEELYKNISLGVYEPKTAGETGIGKYKPGVVDSRGAGFSSEISRNPKYSKDKQNITWGYATNEYNLLKNIQGILHKISKEKIDETGNVKTPKKRKKQGT